ncbi:hypothetical protein BGZ60DRAFT_524321 [Tricladium varicosporioides]|nr:hypothetical protein BGZ60DRAFT_524321 [Hymenoscyphus varicosporioides]
MRASLFKKLSLSRSQNNSHDPISTRNTPYPPHYKKILPQRPRRALTLPLPEASQRANNQTTSLQLASAFLSKTPYEVRLQIYSYLFQENTLYLLWPYVRLTTGVNPPTPGDWFHGKCGKTNKRMGQEIFWERRGPQRFGRAKGWNSPMPKDEILDLGLLYTCRQTYSEVLPIIFQLNTVYFPNPQVLVQFCNISPPQHLELLTSMELLIKFYGRQWLCSTFTEPHVSPEASREYTNAIQLISRMTNLKTLKIAFDTTSPTGLFNNWDVDRPIPRAIPWAGDKEVAAWLAPLQKLAFQLKNLQTWHLAIRKELFERSRGRFRGNGTGEAKWGRGNPWKLINMDVGEVRREVDPVTGVAGYVEIDPYEGPLPWGDEIVVEGEEKL